MLSSIKFVEFHQTLLCPWPSTKHKILCDQYPLSRTQTLRYVESRLLLLTSTNGTSILPALKHNVDPQINRNSARSSQHCLMIRGTYKKKPLIDICESSLKTTWLVRENGDYIYISISVIVRYHSGLEPWDNRWILYINQLELTEIALNRTIPKETNWSVPGVLNGLSHASQALFFLLKKSTFQSSKCMKIPALC